MALAALTPRLTCVAQTDLLTRVMKFPASCITNLPNYQENFALTSNGEYVANNLDVLRRHLKDETVNLWLKDEPQKYPRIQLRTVKELMAGKNIERPSNAAGVDETFKKAPKAKAKGGEQTALGLQFGSIRPIREFSGFRGRGRGRFGCGVSRAASLASLRLSGPFYQTKPCQIRWKPNKHRAFCNFPSSPWFRTNPSWRIKPRNYDPPHLHRPHSSHSSHWSHERRKFQAIAHVSRLSLGPHFRRQKARRKKVLKKCCKHFAL